LTSERPFWGGGRRGVVASAKDVAEGLVALFLGLAGHFRSWQRYQINLCPLVVANASYPNTWSIRKPR